MDICKRCQSVMTKVGQGDKSVMLCESCGFFIEPISKKKNYPYGVIKIMQRGNKELVIVAMKKRLIKGLLNQHKGKAILSRYLRNDDSVVVTLVR